VAEEVKELLVRVSATTELLRSNLVQAERAVAQFEGTTQAATQRVGQAFNRGAVSAGQMRFAMQNLSLQIGDVATQFALGAKPMQIFAAQGSQIVGAIGLMAGEATALGRFLGGPWLQIISAAAIALSPFISRLFDTADAAKTAKNATDDLSDALAKINGGKPAEALGKLRLTLETAQSRLRTLENSPVPIGQGEAGRASAAAAAETRQREIDAARAAVQEARSNFGVAQLRARQVAEQERRAAAEQESRARSRTPRTSRVGRVAVEQSSPLGSTIDALVTDNNRDLFRASEQRIKLLNDANEEQFKAQTDAIRQNAEYEYEQRRDTLERLRQVEQAQLATVATLYESLFRGGTRAIWDDFGQIGRRVIAQVLAKFTIAQVTGKGGGFNLGSALSSAFTSVLGFADGGRPPIGRVSVVGERGPELFVPDVAGTVIPNHAMGGGQQIVINMPNASQETISMVRREIVNAAPMIVAAASGQTSRMMNRRTL